MENPYFPIVYIRGYAMTMGEIDETVADPFMGFNIGSTYFRHDAQAELTRFYFESPVIRLAKDHGYVDAFRHGDFLSHPGSAPSRSIWIFRYYQGASSTLGTRRRQDMENIAIELRRFVLCIRHAVCGEDVSKQEKFRVHLVAHSMGGLVARCYLQNISRHGTGDATLDHELEITPDPHGPARALSHHVDKLFTYGTPHNGIDLHGFNMPQIPFIDGWRLSTFNRKRMAGYLRLSRPSRKGGVNHLDGAFDPRRVFCLMGSNHTDYEAANGWARRAVGPSSDGLVALANAYTEGSSRVVVHRSHSGTHGLVNSESGYQNLRRFLFGTYKVIAKLYVSQVPLPPETVDSPENPAHFRRSFYIEASTWVRGRATYRLNERLLANASAVLKRDDELLRDLPGNKPPAQRFAYLFTGYLMPDDGGDEQRAVFAVDIGMRLAAIERDGRDVTDRLIDGDLLRETLTFEIASGQLHYGIARLHGPGATPERSIASPEATGDPAGSSHRIDLSRQTGNAAVRAWLELAVSDWNTGSVR